MEADFLPIKIMIAEDQAIIRKSLVCLLDGYLNLAVINEAQNGVELLRLLEKDKPDIILMDINMPVLNGFETMRVIDEKIPWVKVIALSVYDHPVFVKMMLKYGAMGFVSKKASLDELYHAIIQVHNGQKVIPRPPDPHDPERKFKISHPELKEGIDALTPREIEVIQLLAEGFLTDEIAKRLYICSKTVEKHKTNILGKLKAKTTPQLVRISLENGLIFH